MRGAKTSINNDIFRNRLKLFYKRVILYYLLVSLAPPPTRRPGRFAPPAPPSYAPVKSVYTGICNFHAPIVDSP